MIERMAITADGIVTVITGVLQTGGIATFVYFLIRSLRHQITTLNTTVEQQQKTLEVMERRVVETEKFGEMYRRMLTDLPADMEKFKEVISHLKDATIAELEKANQSKDEKLKGLTELELKKIEVTEKAIQELPALRDELLATVAAIQQRVETALKYVPEARLRDEDRVRSIWHFVGDTRRRRLLHDSQIYSENYDNLLENVLRRLTLLAAEPSQTGNRLSGAPGSTASRPSPKQDVDVVATTTPSPAPAAAVAAEAVEIEAGDDVKPPQTKSDGPA
jgi:rRNA-processing protein FCF1